MSEYNIFIMALAITVWVGLTLRRMWNKNKKAEYVTVKEEYKTKEVIIDGALSVVWGDNSKAVDEKMQSKLFQKTEHKAPQPATTEVTYNGKFADEPAEVLIRFFNDAVYEIEIMIKPSEPVGSLAVPVLQEILEQLSKKYGPPTETTDLWMMMYQKRSPQNFLIKNWKGTTRKGNNASLMYLPVVRDMTLLIPTALLLIYSDDTTGSGVKAYRVKAKYDGI
ncbi:MAG: hypothetical protein H6Q65_2120 [Firmicutes bacterium]|nr:hypothetical protein [Bacillota bacterium]